LITVQIANGQEIEVDTDDPAVAARAGQNFLRANDPEAFANWNRSRPLGGFWQNFTQAGRGAAGSMIEGAGAVAGEVGLPGEQTLRRAGEAVGGEAPVDRRSFESGSDLLSQFRERPLETARAAGGQALGSVVGSIAAPLAVAGVGAAAGASAPLVAGLGLAAAVGAGALQSTNELEELLINEGVDAARARTLATTIGAGIGALEGGAAARMVSGMLGRQVRRETAEGLARIAARSRTNAAGRGAAEGLVLEGGSEALGGAARQGVAAAETGNLNLAERADQVALDAVLGSLGGSAAGAAGGQANPGRARREIAERTPATPPAPPAPSAPDEASPLPEPPAAFQTPEEAAAYVRSNPEFRPPAGVEGDDLVTWANTQQDRAHRQEVELLRRDGLSRLLAVDAVREVRSEPDAEGNATTSQIRDVQADRLLPTLVRAATEGNLQLDNFTSADVANLALTRLGAADAPTGGELSFVRQQLGALRRAGYLESVGKDTFSVTQRNIDSLRQMAAERQQRGQRSDETMEEARRRQEAERRKEDAGMAFMELNSIATQAPPTADQQAAQDVLEYLSGGEYMQLPAEDRARVVEDIQRSSPQVGSVFSAYEQALQQQELLDAMRAEQPAVVASEEFQRMQQAVAAMRANIVDRLTGFQNLSAVVPAEGQPTITAVPTRGALTPFMQRAAQLNAGRTTNPWQSTQAVQPTVAEPVETQPVEPVVEPDPEPEPPPSPPKPRTPRKKPAASVPAVAPKPLPGRVMSPAEVIERFKNRPTNKAEAAPEEILRDAGLTPGEIRDFQRNPNDEFRQRSLELAKQGYVWWAGNFQPATTEIVKQARDTQTSRQEEANVWRQKVETRFKDENPNARIANVMMSDSAPMTRDEHMRWIAAREQDMAALVKRIERQAKRADSRGPAFEEPDTDGEVPPDGEGPNFAVGAETRPGILPDGLELNDDGSFDYVYEVNNENAEGTVTISGEVLPDEGAVWISTANSTEHIRGEGYGVRAYQNLINWAHTNGYDVWSDAAVSNDAARVYRSLERRGYDVRQAPEAYQADGGWVSYTPETRRTAQPVFKIQRQGAQLAAPQTTSFQPPRTQLDRDVAEQGAERAFRGVLGANGKLEVRDQLFIRDLGANVKQAALDLGMRDPLGEISGVTLGDLAILSLRDNDMPIDQVAVHEGFHVAENLGLFTPNEVELLNANLDKIREVIRTRLPYAPDNLPPQEVRAYGLNARIAERADFGPLVNRIFDKVAQFVERIGNFVRGQGFQTWRDVFDAFADGYMAGREPSNPRYARGQGNVDFAAPRLPADVADAHKVVKRATENQISGFMKWFGSPILTMGKVKPALGAAADTQRTLYTRTNEMTFEAENKIADFITQLQPQEKANVTRVWEEASRLRRKPKLDGLNETERAALTNAMEAFQRGFDYLIESYVWDKFSPDGAKTAGDRARLEKFWGRHSGKHLWEIPKSQLLAASPEGYRMMQEYERARNPYYMPQMARGTHFVAAYRKNGKGERTGPPLRMIAYTPLNVAQKFRGFADPVAQAQAELRRQFPNDRSHFVMEVGQQFTKDNEANQLREQGDFIAQYLEQLVDKGGKAGREAATQMLGQIDKAQMDRIFRPNQGILQAVTPQNEQTYLMDTMPQYLLSLAKIQAKRYTQDAFTRATKNLSPDDKAFLQDLRDYSTTPTEAFGNIRSMAFFMYLGGAFDTALINLTQLPLMTSRVLMRDGGVGAQKHLLSSMADVMRFGAPRFNELASGQRSQHAFIERVMQRLPEDERVAMQQAVRQGVFDPVTTTEARQQFTSEFMRRMGSKNPVGSANNANKLSRLFGLPMKIIEEYNRASTFLAAYRLAKADPDVITRSNKIDNANYETPYSYAMNKVFDSQFLTTKEDRALLQRFTPAAEVATQFMSYPLKTIEIFTRDISLILNNIGRGDPELAKAGAVGLLAFTVPLIAMAGIWALPGADFLKELTERLIGQLWGSTQNFDADLREWLGGGQWAEAAVRGVPHAMGIMGLSRRLSIDPVPFNDLTSLSTLGLFGPAGSLAETYLSTAPQYYRNGDYWNLAAALLPRSLGNVVRGAQVGIEGEQRTLRGNRVITQEMVDQADSRSLLPAFARVALGFPPPEFINAREMVTRSEEIQRQVRAPQQRLNKELARNLTDIMDARRRGDDRGAEAAAERFRARVSEVAAEQVGRPLDRQLNLSQATMQAIQRQAMLDFYGISSEEALSQAPNRRARAEILRQRELLDWRNQGGSN
jgi:hypothetical protein